MIIMGIPTRENLELLFRLAKEQGITTFKDKPLNPVQATWETARREKVYQFLKNKYAGSCSASYN